MHGQTYQAHPTVCAAALEVQRIIAADDLLANVKLMGEYLERALRNKLGDHPHVGNIRGRGLFWGVCKPYFALLLQHMLKTTTA